MEGSTLVFLGVEQAIAVMALEEEILSSHLLFCSLIVRVSNILGESLDEEASSIFTFSKEPIEEPLVIFKRASRTILLTPSLIPKEKSLVPLASFEVAGGKVLGLKTNEAITSNSSRDEFSTIGDFLGSNFF